MNMKNKMDANGSELPLKEIGAVFHGIGITTVELAVALRDHLTACSGGKACLEKLIERTRENTHE